MAGLGPIRLPFDIGGNGSWKPSWRECALVWEPSWEPFAVDAGGRLRTPADSNPPPCRAVPTTVHTRGLRLEISGLEGWTAQSRCWAWRRRSWRPVPVRSREAPSRQRTPENQTRSSRGHSGVPVLALSRRLVDPLSERQYVRPSQVGATVVPGACGTVLAVGPQTDDMARTRCSFGLTPRTRLNAVLSANGLL